MELNFSPLRVTALIVCLIGFAAIGGFTPVGDVSPQLGRLWASTILLFTVSAVSATVVDHWVGNLDRSNLRWFYIVVGIAGMAGGVLFSHVLAERTKLEEGGAGVGVVREERRS